MISTVVGILALSAVGAASGLLFRVDIDFQQKEGRKEVDDISFIQTTLAGATGVNVVTAKKGFDNQKVLLVVEVQKICGWSSLTSAFTEKGYDLSVTPLQDCSEYAMELGVNITYQGKDEIFASDVMDVYDVVIHDEGLKTDEFISRMKSFFKQEVKVVAAGIKSVCYRSYGQLPVKLMYFALTIPPESLEKIYQNDGLEGKSSIVMTRLQGLDVYSHEC